MNFEAVISFLEANRIKYLVDFPTFKLSSFELGGSARVVEYPEALYDLCNSASFFKENGIQFYILGNSTNTFFSEKGFDGVIISTKNLNKIFCEAEYIDAMCGADISDVSMLAMERSLSGAEFCCGIPASVGGAVYMNASAFEKSVFEIVLQAEAYDTVSKKRYTLTNKDIKFGAKSSIFCENRDLVLLSVKFKLSFASKFDISSRMRHIVLKRIESQPLEYGSCGSAFKRPVNAYASRLIDKAGLKGARVGGAEVSKKHAGFIVNVNVANAKDVLKLVDKIKKEVYDKFGVALEEEIIFVE